jgi:cytochrome c-type biogenesis protein CcmF
MLAIIGNILICGALAASIRIIFLGLNPCVSDQKHLHASDHSKHKHSLILTTLVKMRQYASSIEVMQIYFTCCVTFSMLTLIYAFLSSNFSLQNVFINSSSLSPLVYKLAASWASHEGSMLFLITLLSLVSLLAYYKIDHSKIKTNTLVLQHFLISSLLAFLWITANPFKLNSFTPHEGVGLNPLLQDIGLLYHPPILYLGYAFYFVPFCYCVFLYKDKANSVYYFYKLLFFSRVAMMFLTLGIALGGWWAYRELGWGGFWFFDPVENISLLPWLCGIAFHHSILMSIKQNMLKRWSVFLGLFVFPLPLAGMFLVRSNLLVSVHSFALDATKAVALGLVAAITFGLALYSYASYSSETEKKVHILSKESGVVLGNIFWLIAIFSVLVAIIMPIVIKIVYGIEFSLEANYFKITLLPILIAINVIVGIFAYTGKKAGHHFWCLSLSFLLFVCLAQYFSIKALLANAAILFAVFLIVTTTFELLYKSAFFSNALRFGQVAMLLGHFSYAALTLSIALNATLESEVDLIGTQGSTVKMSNFDITMQGIRHSYGPNYLRQIVEVKIEDHKTGVIVKLTPENRWYVIENKMTSDSSIQSFVDYDLYAVLNRVEDDGKVHVKIYYRPYISFIWLSSITLALSFFISIFAIKKRNKLTNSNNFAYQN